MKNHSEFYQCTRLNEFNNAPERLHTKHSPRVLAPHGHGRDSRVGCRVRLYGTCLRTILLGAIFANLSDRPRAHSMAHRSRWRAIYRSRERGGGWGSGLPRITLGSDRNDRIDCSVITISSGRYPVPKQRGCTRARASCFCSLCLLKSSSSPK